MGACLAKAQPVVRSAVLSIKLIFNAIAILSNIKGDVAVYKG